MNFLKEYFFNSEKKFTILELYVFVVVFGILFGGVAPLADINIVWKSEWVEIVKAGASLAILVSIIMAILNYKYIKNRISKKQLLTRYIIRQF